MKKGEEEPLLQNQSNIVYPAINMDAPPSYEEALNNTPSHETTLPEITDFSQIPQGHTLFNDGRTISRIRSPASFEMNSSGIKTFDKLLDKDPEELWKFFISHLNKPKILIKIKGHHTETHYDTDNTTREEEVIDFEFQLDMTQYISDNWIKIQSEPRKAYPQKSYKESLQEYTQSDNKFKEIYMQKQVIWNYDEMGRVIEYCIRNTGYKNQLKITFPVQNDKVYVYSSNEYHQLSHNNALRCILCVTCLWIVALPFYCLLRKKNSNKLIADFEMTVTPAEFYSRNYYHIQSLCINMTRSSTPFNPI
jgi:hypothetical protein